MIGLGFGIAASLLIAQIGPRGAAIAAIPVLAALLIRPRAATAGGALSGGAVLWAYWFWAAQQRCAEMNLGPNSGCAIGDNTLQGWLLATTLIVGVLFGLVALRRDRAGLTY